jgi:hypothetical protein
MSAQRVQSNQLDRQRVDIPQVKQTNSGTPQANITLVVASQIYIIRVVSLDGFTHQLLRDMLINWKEYFIDPSILFDDPKFTSQKFIKQYIQKSIILHFEKIDRSVIVDVYTND